MRRHAAGDQSIVESDPRWCTLRTMLAVVLGAAVAGCDALKTTFPTDTDDTAMRAGILAQLPPDPCEECDGVWIGYSDTECFTTLADDQDQDGLKDTCERRFAEFFAPRLVMSQSDSHRGQEPYWAARWSDDESSVRLFWALAYYMDGGTGGFGCEYSQGYCGGHYGDSEWVLLDLEYNSDSQHWELATGILSQHGWFEAADGDDFSYVGSYLGHPTIYVAWGKHSNYTTDSDCDAGGFLSYDECYSDYAVRAYYSAYRNLGSSAHPLKDCVPSFGSYAGNGEEECFWTTTSEFLGRTGVDDIPDETDPYVSYLALWGF